VEYKPSKKQKAFLSYLKRYGEDNLYTQISKRFKQGEVTEQHALEEMVKGVFFCWI